MPTRGIILCVVVLSIVASWQATTVLRQGPTDVIKAQLSAFNREDFRKAYSYAADGIRRRMPLEAFRRMIVNAYPQFGKSRKADFGRAQITKGTAVVEVTLVGQDGVTVHALYFMKRELGGWKVAGVQVDGRGTGANRGQSA